MKKVTDTITAKISNGDNNVKIKVEKLISINFK